MLWSMGKQVCLVHRLHSLQFLLLVGTAPISELRWKHSCPQELQAGSITKLPLPSRRPEGGRNSSVGSAWARCPQHRGFDPPLGTFSGRGDFSLGVNMGSNSIPPKTPSNESINRGLVCACMHFIARTQKILTFMS